MCTHIIWSHLFTLLATFCLIHCMTKYYKMPHKHKIHVVIGWTIVTQNTHLPHFKKHLVTLIDTFGHFLLNYMWQNCRENNLCVTKYYKTSHKYKIHVTIGWMIVTQNTYLLDFKKHVFILINSFVHFLPNFMWWNPLKNTRCD